MIKNNKNQNFMYTIKSIKYVFVLLVGTITLAMTSCEKYAEDLAPNNAPTNGDVFIDAFTGGMNYAAFGNSVVTAFQVDNEVTYNGTASSMRVDVPRENDPRGTYAGGTYFLSSGRNLSGYNVLTFWARANKSALINEIGFGNDLGENKYATAITNVPVTTEWQKYYIPIPDPSKLTNEKGMLYFSEGHENGEAYSFWIDEVQFENLGTITQGESLIYDGKNLSSTLSNGSSSDVSDLFTSFSLPDGTQVKIATPASYFTFESSNSSVASVDNAGKITALSNGFSVISASLAGIKVSGSMVVNVEDFTHAPTPAEPASNVISLFSDNYTNVNVDFYNGYWEPYQTTTSSDFNVGNDNILNYLNFNFVGIQFSSPTVDATNMTTLSMDIFVPDDLNPGVQFKITVKDFGPDGADGGDDDIQKDITFTNVNLASGEWKTLKIPLAGMTSKSKIGQIILSDSDLGNFKNFYLDNIYFHN